VAEELVSKIEKLITNGNKEVLEKIGAIESGLKSVESSLHQEIRRVETSLGQRIDRVESSLHQEIKQTYDFLSYDIKEVEKKVDDVKMKLDKHLRIPHSV